MMEPWQRLINNQLKNTVIEVARTIKGRNEGHGIGLNYAFRWPQYFVPGQSTAIPVTIPSSHGPLHIADAVVDISMDGTIVSVPELRIVSELKVYDPTQTDFGVQGTTTAGFLGKWTRFLSDINNIMRSQAATSLAYPRQAGSYGNIAMPNQPSNIPIGNSGIGGIKVNTRKPGNWSAIQANNANAEAVRASKITGTDGQKAFIKEALNSPTKAPHWFTALGGKQKENAASKIKDAYMGACKQVGKTIPPTTFFNKMAADMAQKQQLAPYCERDRQRVQGTTDGQCLQQNCNQYSPSCPRFSYRLNTRV